jgi:hypothetical protein
LNNEHLNKHIYSTRKGFEECVREETAHLATLKSKKYYVYILPKDIAEIETGIGEKSNPGTRQTDGKNLVWFGEIERNYQCLPLHTILPLNYLMAGPYHPPPPPPRQFFLPTLFHTKCTFGAIY